MKPLVVAFVAVENMLAMDLAGPAEVLAQANRVREPRAPLYELVYLSRRGGTVRTVSDIDVVTRPLSSIAPASIDTLIVAGGRLVGEALRDVKVIEWIARAAPKVRRVCSVCTGSFLLAAAGLLDGRRAATHWDYAREFRARFPTVRLELDPIFVRDGRIWTSAGVSSGIDLALALVEHDLDRQVSMQVARQLVVFMKRPGGQAQFSTPLAGQAEAATRGRDARIERMQAWIADHLDRDLTVEKLAEHARMPARTFARLFTSCTGKTPAKAVESMRLETACRMLVESNVPHKKLAAACGFNSEEHLRRAFLRRFGVAPGAYRRTFSSTG
jgi:transcriptional regulator GlxA family with amidase domain